MQTLVQDLRYASRMLVKNPGFTALAVTALALGLGANTAIFSVVNSILLKPLPYADPQRLVVALHNGNFPVSPADFLDYQRDVHAFEQIAAAQAWGGRVTGPDGPEMIPGLQVGANMIDLLGVAPKLGRSFNAADGNAADGRPGAPHVLLLSHARELPLRSVLASATRDVGSHELERTYERSPWPILPCIFAAQARPLERAGSIADGRRGAPPRGTISAKQREARDPGRPAA